MRALKIIFQDEHCSGWLKPFCHFRGSHHGKRERPRAVARGESALFEARSAEFTDSSELSR